MSDPANASRFLATPVAPLSIAPVTLEGQVVRLEPLSMDHHTALCEFALDVELWRWTVAQVTTPDEMRAYIEGMLKQQAEGSTIPFATIYKSENRVVGSTRYLSIDKLNRHVEIGSTFVGTAWQRTAINTEAKYLMLQHAFETLGCLRVEFKTDVLNTKSRNALQRIGAQQEGIFRNHILCANGRVRDSVYFSITDTEWASTVKADLQAKLARV